MNKKPSLGKGLRALIPDLDLPEASGGDYFFCPIEEIIPNPRQPRRRIHEGDLTELVQSIKVRGILQPLIVRKMDKGYELIAGERRWRAAQKAGLSEVPVLIKKEVSSKDSLEMALIENIQRQDLNPLEEGEAYHRLMEDYGLSQEELSRQVGKERATVANYLRLNRLSEPVKVALLEEKITMGHARALLALEDPTGQQRVLAKILHKSLSVRETERETKQQKAPRKKAPELRKEIYFEALAAELTRHLQTRVRIKGRSGKGRIEIEYYSPEQLEQLLERLKKN
jgi:ParB family chromosome partitioning protein